MILLNTPLVYTIIILNLSLHINLTLDKHTNYIKKEIEEGRLRLLLIIIRNGKSTIGIGLLGGKVHVIQIRNAVLDSLSHTIQWEKGAMLAVHN